VSIYEIAFKASIGKLDFEPRFERAPQADIERVVAREAQHSAALRAGARSPAGVRIAALEHGEQRRLRVEAGGEREDAGRVER